jgi:hypothetical protein
VLVLAVGAEHPLREPCRRLMELIGARQITASTTAEVIQEVAHVRARRHGRADAVRLARRYTELLAPLLTVDADSLDAGLRLFEQRQGLGAFDAVLVAAAVAADADAIVSADTDFADVPRLRYVQPGTDEFEELLSRT